MRFYTLLLCLNSIWWGRGMGPGEIGRASHRNPNEKSDSCVVNGHQTSLLFFSSIPFQYRSNFITKKRKKKKSLYESNKKSSVLFSYTYALFLTSLPHLPKMVLLSMIIYLVRLTFTTFQNHIYHQTLVPFLMGPI